MKHKKTSTLLFALLATGVLGLTACKNGDGNGGKTDPAKTTLRVYSFTGGFGSQWLTRLASAYEEKVKERSFEDGKTGVQVITTAVKADVLGTAVPTSGYDVLFLEQHDFSADVNNHYYADISDVVKEANPYDGGKAIESKMSDSQKEMFSVEGAYYALPHYATPFGIVYNIDLFEEKNYYLAKTPGDSNKLGSAAYFVNDANTERSLGPDGKAGTSDDGLPATYEEFWRLCDWIRQNNDNPIIFGGTDVLDTYVSFFANQLAVDYAGYEQTMLSYHFTGSATKLATVQNGKLVMDESPTEITVDNNDGKELRRNAGYYYALQFLSKMFSSFENASNPGYLYPSTFSSENYLTAQRDFIQRDDVAMLIDGMWSENEADEVGHSFAKGKTRDGRKIGWMPLPKATQEQVGEGQTFYDVYFPECFVNASSQDGALAAAKDFLRFAYSDAQLVDFTKTTGALKAVKYQIPETDLASMNTYGRSVAALKNAECSGDGSVSFVYPLAGNSLYRNHHAYFDIVNASSGGMASSIQGTVHSHPALYLYQNKGTKADPSKGEKAYQDYFAGMYTYAANQSFFSGR